MVMKARESSKAAAAKRGSKKTVKAPKGKAHAKPKPVAAPKAPSKGGARGRGMARPRSSGSWLGGTYYFLLKYVRDDNDARIKPRPRTTLSMVAVQPTWHLMSDGGHADSRNYRLVVSDTLTGSGGIKVQDLDHRFKSVGEAEKWLSSGEGQAWLGKAEAWGIGQVSLENLA